LDKLLGYLLSDDLIFTSRVTGTARALGLDVQTARSPTQLAVLLAARAPQCILIDLHNPGLAASDLMRELPQPRPFVVGYGSHVDTATLQAAREAGFDLVLPRSKFVDGLATSLPEWLGADRPKD
jgi:CheY-like chemotaxis protein